MRRRKASRRPIWSEAALADGAIAAVVVCDPDGSRAAARLA
jgi:hypothetical protein